MAAILDRAASPVVVQVHVPGKKSIDGLSSEGIIYVNVD